LLRQQAMPPTAEELFGAELANRLVSSAPRPLNILYECEGALDCVDWEHVSLGAANLAEHFAVGRQLSCDADGTPPPVTQLAESLAAWVVHGGVARACLPAQRLAFDAIDQDWAHEALASAHVLVLDGVVLQQVLARANLPRRQRLLILAGPESTQHLAGALDAGAAVLCMTQPDDLYGEPVVTLAQKLASGLSVGEAIRWLHRRTAPQRFEARLYGDPEMRFVRAQVPTSRRQVTSLSFDLVGSTSLLEALGDEAYAETLSIVHARCTDVVRRHGGQPDDPQGDDGVMNYFGHPAALEDAAVHAVGAGLGIARTVAELGVSVRVGIATGRVAIKAGQPVGLSIHHAARLQQVAAAGTVLVSESTRRLIEHAFDLKRLEDRPNLKGIDASEAVYLVLGPRADRQEHRLERLPALTPLVGRRAELERLQDCWRATCAGGGKLVVIRAEAGMGKSRLVREFRHHLVLEGAKVMECHCRADASASPLLTLAESLRRWLAIGANDATDVALRKLAAAMPGGAREGESFPWFAALLGLAPQPQEVRAGSQRRRQLALLVDWFQAFARDNASCLIVEDWQWADPSTRELVELLVGRPGAAGLLVVITVRSEAEPPSFAAATDAHIELTGLPPEAARDLVERVCADAPLPPRLVALLAARGDGVPLFLEEAARMALETGVSGTDGELHLLESVPASLQDLLTARLDALGAAKPVAQVAAVLGRQFPRALLAALLDAAGHALDAVALEERLAVLVGSGLIRSDDDGRFAFRHTLIRDAAYASLWARDRHTLHERVVTLLKERWPELAALQPELLAQHLTEAGLHAEAVAQWELAARHAAARSAELEAITHLRRALTVLMRTEATVERDRTALRLQLLLAARLLATEGYGADAVLQAYREAERLCDHIGDDTARFKVEMGLEAYRFMRADFAPALEHGRRAAVIAAHSGDIKQRLNAHWGLACTLFHQGDLRATMREMETALALYTPAMHPQFGIQDPGVMCMAYSSWGLWELGRPDAALARIKRAVGLADQFEHRFSQAVALAYAVSIELLRGETDAALARAETCMRVCEEAGFPVWLAITRCMRGYLMCERGEFDSGLREMNTAFAQWLATGAVVSQPLYLALQVEGLLLADQLDAAAERVREGLAIVGRYGERQLESELTRLRGEIALRRGDATAGEDWLKRAYALALRQRRLGFALRSATSLARHWATTGRGARARRLLVPLTGRWSEGRGTRDLRSAAALIESLDDPLTKGKGRDYEEETSSFS
jgi:class 3 adenylate cyclase/tetratricopeptide (TPR) repeat protein